MQRDLVRQWQTARGNYICMARPYLVGIIASSSVEANIQLVGVMTAPNAFYRPRIEPDLGRVADALRPSLHELSVWAEIFRML